MDLIRDLLSKYTNLTPLHSKDKEEIIKIIKNLININLEISNLDIKNSKLNIKCSPIIKTEIFLNKQKLLSEINTKLNNLNLLDIN